MESEHDRRRKRRVLLLAGLLVSVALLVLFLGRGKSPPGEPEPGGPSSPAEDLPPARGATFALRIRIEAEDELPLVIRRRDRPRLADGVALVEEEDQPAYLLLSAEVVRALESGKGDESVRIGVGRVEDLGVVVVIETRYRGRGRHGVRRRVELARDLPPFPGGAVPERAIRLTPDGGEEILDNILPLRSLTAWKIEEGRLRAGEHRLARGEEAELPAAEARIRLREVRHKLIPQGVEPEDPFATEELDHGEVLFRCRVQVRFLGEVPVRVEEEGP